MIKSRAREEKQHSIKESVVLGERVGGYLNEMAETAERFGVTLYHENEKEIYGDRSERVLEIMKNVKKLKYVYDPANYLQVGEEADTAKCGRS